jgi:hypothetical protein
MLDTFAADDDDDFFVASFNDTPFDEQVKSEWGWCTTGQVYSECDVPRTPGML